MPNRKAIVVGASRGIGRSIALTLASAGGWDVGLMARSVAALQSVARECAAVNKHCTVVVAPSDVCHPTAHAKAMRRCLAALQDKRRDDAEGVKGPFLHALIYCTGVDASQHTMWLGDISKSSSSSSRSMRGDSTGAVGDTMGADAPGIDAVMRPNFNGCVRTVAHCHTALIAAAAAAAEEGYDGPSIVLISSIIVHARGLPGMAAYTASKYALHGYAKVLFQELRHLNVRVSCICPGLVNTAMASSISNNLAEAVSGSAAGGGAGGGAGAAAAASGEAGGTSGARKGQVNFADMSIGMDIQPHEMVQAEDVAATVRYVLEAADTCCPSEVWVEHAQHVSKVESFLVEQVDSPQGPPACIHPVIKPHRPVAFITGASRGIGKAVALDLAAQGCSVALVARGAAELQEVAEQCETAGKKAGYDDVEALVLVLDVSDIDALRDAVHTTVEKLGSLSCIVCNAGINRRKSSLAAGRKVWDQVLDIDMRSVVHLTRLALPYIQQAKPRHVKSVYHNEGAHGTGSVIYMLSMSITTLGMAGMAPYFCAKAGIAAFARCVWADVKQLGIKVSVIAPALTNTKLGTRPGPVHMLQPHQMLQPQDCAMAVRHVLASPPRATPTMIQLAHTAQPVFPFAFAADRLWAKGFSRL